MVIDSQAEELNVDISKQSPVVLSMLSDEGLHSFFPKAGVASQIADAGKTKYNATIGAAYNEDGSLMTLPSVEEAMNRLRGDSFEYAPNFGIGELREKWKELIIEKSPSINFGFSLPLVTSGLTHGLSISKLLFLSEGDNAILTDLYWSTYELVFGDFLGNHITTFRTFDKSNSGFNVSGLDDMLNAGGDKKILLLNFPNNPTGYTPIEKEADDITDILFRAADTGKRIVVLLDDAYFGLVHRLGVYTESMFAKLGGLHENILVVKIDGATKEDYFWGGRVGFTTFASPRIKDYTPLERKAAGEVRKSVSNVSNISQRILIGAYNSHTIREEKERNFQILKTRYNKANEIISSNPDYSNQFISLPSNSGYFLCVMPLGIDSEELRRKLLEPKYDTGVIAIKGMGYSVIRIAFARTPLVHLEPVFYNINQACKELRR